VKTKKIFQSLYADCGLLAGKRSFSKAARAYLAWNKITWPWLSHFYGEVEIVCGVVQPREDIVSVLSHYSQLKDGQPPSSVEGESPHSDVNCRQLLQVYEERVRSGKRYESYCNVVDYSRRDVDDKQRPGIPNTSTTDYNACRVDVFIRGDWLVRPTDMARKLDIVLGSANSTVHHQRDYTKVRVGWMSQNLRDDHHACRAGLSHAFDTSSPWKGSLCAANFTRDETWVNQRHLNIHDVAAPTISPSKETERNAVSEKDQGDCVFVKHMRATFGFLCTRWRCHSWQILYTLRVYSRPFIGEILNCCPKAS
jgi:hypothetical protein